LWREFGQWWLLLNSNFYSDHHISLGGLLSGFHPDHTDIGLYSDGEWYGEFQQRRDLVPQPVRHRLREQHWYLYANDNRNRNHYGHIHAGRNHIGFDGSHRHESNHNGLRIRGHGYP
jgi:hypothetical protein